VKNTHKRPKAQNRLYIQTSHTEDSIQFLNQTMKEQPTASYTRGEIMPEEVESRIEKAQRTLKSLNNHSNVSA